jgi:hypothetical protein
METLPYVGREATEDPEALPLMRKRQQTLIEIVAPPSSRAPADAAVNLTSAGRELENAKTSWDAAATCARLVCEALGARAVLVLSFVASEGMLRVIGTAGANATDLLGETIAPDDFISEAVLYNLRSLVLTFDDAPPAAPARLRELDARSALIAVPIIAQGQCVGVIEVVNPKTHEGHIVGAIEHLARALSRFFPRRTSPKRSGTNPVAAAPPSQARKPARRYALFHAWLKKRAAERP